MTSLDTKFVLLSLDEHELIYFMELFTQNAPKSIKVFGLQNLRLAFFASTII